MPEISLLDPIVLNGVIETFVAPPENVATSLFGTPVPYLETVMKWDVIHGSRQRATPTLPNREGKLVDQLGVSQKTANFIYVREKKAFEPTTLRWLREPGQLFAANAEAAVMREVKDLNYRVDRLIESYCWDALKGLITIDEPDVKATIDFGFSADHTPLAATLWSDASADILGNIKAWKKKIVEDSGVPPTDVYLGSDTMDYVYKNTEIKGYFATSPKYTEEYLLTGNVTGLLGLNWHVFDGAYVDPHTKVLTPYIPHTHLIMLSREGKPFSLYFGPSADDDAPSNQAGKFSKTWNEKDPSGRFCLLELNFMPVIEKVDNVIYAEVLSS